MDYEKKYNEALERAKEIKGKILQSHLSTESCKAISEYIDTIIPELKESKDERIIEEIKFAVMQMPSERQDTKQRCLTWLEKQKEQKPAEWSKEDIKNLDYCLRALSGFASEDAYNAKKFLKSLRPSWKPSEEQMEALKNVIRITSSGKNNDLLRTLFIDLEKLI